MILSVDIIHGPSNSYNSYNSNHKTQNCKDLKEDQCVTNVEFLNKYEYIYIRNVNLETNKNILSFGQIQMLTIHLGHTVY